MPEKLISIKEVAGYLKVSEEEVKRLVDAGEIPAYKIGGTFLRFRKEQIDVIRNEIDLLEKQGSQSTKPVVLDKAGHPTHPYSDMERVVRKTEPYVRQYDYTAAERIKDFFYFNDFYIFCFVIIAALMYLIFRT